MGKIKELNGKIAKDNMIQEAEMIALEKADNFSELDLSSLKNLETKSLPVSVLPDLLLEYTIVYLSFWSLTNFKP